MTSALGRGDCGATKPPDPKAEGLVAVRGADVLGTWVELGDG